MRARSRQRRRRDRERVVGPVAGAAVLYSLQYHCTSRTFDQAIVILFCQNRGRPPK